MVPGARRYFRSSSQRTQRTAQRWEKEFPYRPCFCGEITWFVITALAMTLTQPPLPDENRLRKARGRAAKAACRVDFVTDDVTRMDGVAENRYDWLVSTFLCCVMPDALQPLALSQFRRVLKPGGRFRILEILYSKNPRIRRRQEHLARFVEKVYGARFDRSTLHFLEESPCLRITRTTYLKDDTYLLIDGVCVK